MAKTSAKASVSNATKKAAAKKSAAQKTAAAKNSAAAQKTKTAAKKSSAQKPVDNMKEALLAPNPSSAPSITKTTVVKPKISTEQFIKEVKLEAQKVTWPSRKEVMITTGMVMWLVALASIFLLVVDLSLQYGTQSLLTWFTK